MTIGVILSACSVEDQGGIYLTNTPLPQTEAYLNVNPELKNGGCTNTSFYDNIFGIVIYEQCVPEFYSLYELRVKVTGASDLFDNRPTTLPIRVSHTGAVYTIHPGGRAGRIGWTSPGIEFEPGCKLFTLYGYLDLEGAPEEYAGGVMVGEEILWQSQLPTNGDFMMEWHWATNENVFAPVTIFLNFFYGSATASSFINIHRFEVTHAEMARCK
jgi:hypothetical protein